MTKDEKEMGGKNYEVEEENVEKLGANDTERRCGRADAVTKPPFVLPEAKTQNARALPHQNILFFLQGCFMATVAFVFK